VIVIATKIGFSTLCVLICFEYKSEKKLAFGFFFGFLRIFLVEARENHQITIFSSDQNPKKCKIAILNIDSILNGIFLSLKNMKVLKFAGLKWVYMLKSVEKWLCKI
jgi:hypothetical protein